MASIRPADAASRHISKTLSTEAPPARKRWTVELRPADTLHREKQRRTLGERAHLIEITDGTCGNAHSGNRLTFFPQPRVTD